MMTRNDKFEFRPRPGRVRDRRARSGHRSRSFVGQVLAAAIKANGGVLPPAQMREQRPRTGERMRPRKGRCCRIGRGQGVADRLKFIAGERGRAERMRRVVIKARIVRLKLGSRAADAHVRYLQRDGTTHDGERGRLYAAETDDADGKTFIERGREDRHQFRFIVAPEDGNKFSDLRAFTRDVMRQMEKDLGTGLDWVAVDHFNTGHPTAMSSSAAATTLARTSSSRKTTSPTGCGCVPSIWRPWSLVRKLTSSCGPSSRQKLQPSG
jgi:hypothetical protein